MTDLPTFARPGVPMPQTAPQQPAAPQQAAPMPPQRPGSFPAPAGTPLPPSRPQGLGVQGPPMSAMPAPVAAPPAAPPQPAMNSAQIDTGESNILDQIGGFLNSLFAQRQAPPGMQWDAMQGWVPGQKGPTDAA